MNLLRADSHAVSSLKFVEKTLAGNKLDFIFIDGDHTYDKVKKDHEMYGTLAKSDGVIAFHDIVPGNDYYVGGSPEFWNEINQKYRHVEIVEN